MTFCEWYIKLETTKIYGNEGSKTNKTLQKRLATWGNWHFRCNNFIGVKKIYVITAVNGLNFAKYENNGINLECNYLSTFMRHMEKEVVSALRYLENRRKLFLLLISTNYVYTNLYNCRTKITSSLVKWNQKCTLAKSSILGGWNAECVKQVV